MEIDNGIGRRVFTDLLHRHRSIRKFRPDPVDSNLIEGILEASIAGTSSSGNLNSYSVILTQKEEMKKRLFELHFEQPMVLEAPLVMTFCADWHRTREWLRLRKARDNFGNLLGYHVALIDAALLAQTVSLACEDAGLGICYLGTTLESMGQIAELFDLPETCLPVTTIVVGHPDEDPAKRDRLPFKAIVHQETYHRPSEEETAESYADKERRGWDRYMANPETKAAAEERGITSLAQYYTSELKYDPESFAVASEVLLRVIKDSGFMP